MRATRIWISVLATPYLVGEQFTIADAHCFTVTNWAPRVAFDLAPYQNVLAHQTRIGARPSVEAAVKAEGPIPQ